MNKPIGIDWMAASISIEEAMNDDGSGKTYVENEHLLALPINGALMYYVDELACFELATRNEPDFVLRFDELERFAPYAEWERAS
jgi:hypothetical protein